MSKFGSGDNDLPGGKEGTANAHIPTTRGHSRQLQDVTDPGRRQQQQLDSRPVQQTPLSQCQPNPFPGPQMPHFSGHSTHHWYVFTQPGDYNVRLSQGPGSVGTLPQLQQGGSFLSQGMIGAGNETLNAGSAVNSPMRRRRVHFASVGTPSEGGSPSPTLSNTPTSHERGRGREEQPDNAASMNSYSQLRNK